MPDHPAQVLLDLYRETYKEGPLSPAQKVPYIVYLLGLSVASICYVPIDLVCKPYPVKGRIGVPQVFFSLPNSPERWLPVVDEWEAGLLNIIMPIPTTTINKRVNIQATRKQALFQVKEVSRKTYKILNWNISSSYVDMLRQLRFQNLNSHNFDSSVWGPTFFKHRRTRTNTIVKPLWEAQQENMIRAWALE